MTKLSVNINKIATLRNARGGMIPDVVKAAINAERFGAQGITVHPRPDERHIRYDDVRKIKSIIKTELNIEGNPREKKFIELVLEVKPDQVTLVPDSEGQLTSDHGWDTIRYKEYLTETIRLFRSAGIRTSIFIDADEKMAVGAKTIETDRIELYTESYARDFSTNPGNAIRDFIKTAAVANGLGIGVNAGHDLNLDNLNYFKKNIPGLLEVSIGHALICDSLYLGMENTIQLYLRKLK